MATGLREGKYCGTKAKPEDAKKIYFGKPDKRKARREGKEEGSKRDPWRHAIAGQNRYAKQIDAEDTSAPEVRRRQGKSCVP